MRPQECLVCTGFPCTDVLHPRFAVPPVDLHPESIGLVLLAEAPAASASDDLWAERDPFFWETTRQALADAGLTVATPHDLPALGIYPTTAIKCAKVGDAVGKETVRTCADMILRSELPLFPNLRAIVLMGDVAIQALNHLARQATGKAVIPSGSTYKLRGSEYLWGRVRVFPSYLATGRSFLIEKSKRGMIAEDLRAAFALSLGR
jgi:hypothetical protein